MLLIIPLFIVLWTVTTGHRSLALPLAVETSGDEVMYHVGNIEEHAYTHEITPSPSFNTHQQQQPPIPNVQQFLVQPHLQQPTFGDHQHRHQSTTKPSTTTVKVAETTTLRKATSTSTTTTTTGNKIKTLPTTGAPPTPPSHHMSQIDSNETHEGDGSEHEGETEQSLAAFLAMLEETRHVGSEVTRKERKLSGGDGHTAPNAAAAPVVLPPPPPQPLPAAAQVVAPPPSSSGHARRGPYEDWAMYDDLDTQESNQTAVVASSQTFGYVVNGNNYKRFRVEGKASNGLINGLYGFHHHNGNIRGVQYTADPSINPKFLYDTLVKFFSS